LTGRAMSKASNMSGAAIIAGLSVAAACIAAVWIAMEQQSTPDPKRVVPLIVAGLCGCYAGFWQLSRNLGQGFSRSALFGVGASIIAFLIFSGLSAVRSAYIFHTTVQFDSAKQALFHLLEVFVASLQRPLDDPMPTLVLLGGGLAAGIISEVFARLWATNLQ
ncbi:MAG: hypothetical protein ACPGGK_18315, partial [Pikeienuella sp.]